MRSRWRPFGYHFPLVQAIVSFKGSYLVISLENPNMIYPFLRSILGNIVGLGIISNITSSREMGNLFFNVILFMALPSLHICRLPSFLWDKRAGMMQGPRFSLKNPLSNNSCTWNWSSLCQVGSKIVLGKVRGR